MSGLRSLPGLHHRNHLEMECLTAQGFHSNDNIVKNHRKFQRPSKYNIRSDKRVERFRPVRMDFLRDSKPHSKSPLAFKEHESAMDSAQTISNLVSGAMDRLFDKKAHVMSKESPSVSFSRRSSLPAPHLANITLETVSYSVAAQEKIKAPGNVVMALAFAALGISAAAKKGGLFGNRNQAQMKVCERCNGYGLEKCDICNGKGEIKWEGKLRHADPCPLCFGSCKRKCTACDGLRLRKLKLVAVRQRQRQNKLNRRELW